VHSQCNNDASREPRHDTGDKEANFTAPEKALTTRAAQGLEPKEHAGTWRQVTVSAKVRMASC